MTDLPTPLSAAYPDAGGPVYEYDLPDTYRLTVHDDCTFRLWSGLELEGQSNYYPIEVVGMTRDEVERAIEVACRLLAMPHNRKARRARSLH